MNLIADMHCHTVASGHAYSTVEEIAREASNKGLEMVAITDHGPSMPGGPHRYYFGNLRALPHEMYGVRILKGVEANIMDYEGNIDLPARYLDMLDVVLAGFHTYCYPNGTIEENTMAMINTIKNPYVDIIVHPGNPEFPIKINKVVEAAKEYNVNIEINNSSFTVSRKGSEDNCLAIAKKAAIIKAPIVIGSDAHSAFYVGTFDKAVETVKKSGIKEEQVLNTSMERIIEFLKNR